MQHHVIGMVLRFLALAIITCAAVVSGCSDAVCGVYKGPHAEHSKRPPSKTVLGRATWTVMHSTAAYLPDKLDTNQIAAFRTLVASTGLLYPGDGRSVADRILNDDTVMRELDGVKSKEAAQLFVWKIHNAVSAALHPAQTPFPASSTLHPSSFAIITNPSGQFLLKSISPSLKKEVLSALNRRWVITGGLEATHKAVSDDPDLPPDREMLGRAHWTYIHTLSVYLPHIPDEAQLANYRGLFDVLYHIYACPLCRHHFSLFYLDPILQAEHASIWSKQSAILFAWKLHNIVTADGIKRGDWPDRKLFPDETLGDANAHLNVSQFLIPSPTAESTQIRLHFCTPPSKIVPSGAKEKAFIKEHAPDPKGPPLEPPHCIDEDDLYQVISDYQDRWMIEGGIDQPLVDDSPLACPPPSPTDRVLSLDVFIMGKCPWCGKAIANISDLIKCDYACTTKDGQHISARLNFNIHMVGLNNGTWAQPWLRSIHGPAELVADRLELCARQHYAKDYKYVKFLHCMDENVTTIPIRAPECAYKHDMDLDLLISCANDEGASMVATSYGYSSWLGIDITPTLILNHKRKELGLPHNFSDIMCEEAAKSPLASTLAQTSATADATAVSTAKSTASDVKSTKAPTGLHATKSEGMDLTITGLVVGAITVSTLGMGVLVMRWQRPGRGGREQESLIANNNL